jgi:DNA (cytosine-5)-methyltransferase 1
MLVRGTLDILNNYYKIDKNKKVRMIELFGGYGSQSLAMKYLGANYESYRLCEWAAKSIQAYNDVHVRDYTNYSESLTDDEVLDKLVDAGVSLDYDKPATRQELSRQDYRRIYNNIIATKDKVDVARVKGSDLGIVDKDKYEYVLSYSYPCQSLSAAGHRDNLKTEDSITEENIYDIENRSSLLWQVGRILDECNEINALPQVLVMENVNQVHAKANIGNLNVWIAKLKKLGYTTKYMDLKASELGIPQKRVRTIAISVLGNYDIKFPEPIELKTKLYDILQENVDEKYYLTQAQIDGVKKWKAFQKPLKEMVRMHTSQESITLTTRSGAFAAGMVLVDDKEVANYHQRPTRYLENKTYIRHFTPTECGRLMGVASEDIKHMAEHQSDDSLYHLYGDSIVTSVLMACFDILLDIDWKSKVYNINLH